MDGYLKQSTASQGRTLGPFVDDTDFKTAETALTIANTDIKISKAGGALGSKNSGGGTADALGYYTVTWDATDTATVGELKYTVKVAGALVVFGSYWVLEEAVYDALFGASAVGYVTDQPVNATKVGGTTVTGRDIGASVLLSSGTGTGQLDFTSGVVKSNLSQILGTALTETAGQIAAGFKKFFNIGSPASTMDALTLVATATNLTNAPTNGDLTAAMKTSVNAEVVDALNVDTYAEPGQEAPGATVSLAKKIGYLYKMFRNKKTQTSTTFSLFADDASTVDQKATVSDDATTATRGEVASGP